MKRDLEKAREWQRRSKPLRQRSKKTEKLYVERRVIVAELVGTPCQVGWNGDCDGVTVDVHEPLTRARGGSIIDRENCVGTCRSCHDLIHANPEEAERRGFLRHSWAA